MATDEGAALPGEVRGVRPARRAFALAVETRGGDDAVRAAEARRQTARGDRQLIKGSRRLLLRNAKNLKRKDRVKRKRKDRVKRKERLAVNRRLATAYILKDDLKSLWSDRRPAAALSFRREWRRRAA